MLSPIDRMAPTTKALFLCTVIYVFSHLNGENGENAESVESCETAENTENGENVGNGENAENYESTEKAENSENGDQEEDKMEKAATLRIDVTKRVENCNVKSRNGDILHVHYRGTLEDGTEFGDSHHEHAEIVTFTLGTGRVIKGWEQGLTDMCEGEERKLVVPPDLAYGEKSVMIIPAYATLVFDVELVRIERHGDEL